MDNTDVSELEDGEIVDYTPLERPVTYAAPNGILDLGNSDEGADGLSDSGSDDSDSPCFKIKRQKFHSECHTPIVTNQSEKKKKKYDIWCSELQESALTDNLINIDVTNKNIDRSRNVESYDYSLAYTQHERNCTEEEGERHEWEPSPVVQSNKRRFEDRGSVKQRLGRRDSSLEARQIHRHQPRLLPDLAASTDATLEVLAADIADKLQEHKEELILRVVEVLGKRKAIEIFEETKRIEEDGGLLIMNGRRRRTPGGVYLFLIKKDDYIPQEKKQRIFHEDFKPNREDERIIRQKRKTDNFKNHLSEVDLPKLLTRAELATSEIEEGEVEDTTNPPPPPSPATDGRSDGEDAIERSLLTISDECGRTTVMYSDDDFLDVGCNSMDIF